MQNNRLPLLLGLLVLLLLVAWWSGVFESNPSTLDVPKVEIDIEATEAFAVVSPDLDLRLARPDGGWQLMTPVAAKADSATVAGVLEDLSELDIASYVSGNPARYAEFGVDSSATRVEIDGFTLYLSERGPDFSSTYIRVAGDERVFSTRSRISVPSDLDRWRDKRLVDFSGKTVVRASLMGDDASYSLGIDANGWSIQDGDGAPQAADSAAVAQWIGRFSPLRADGFYADLTPDSVFSAVTGKLSFGLLDGSTTELSLSERGDGLAAVLGGGQDVYKLFSTRKALLNPAREELSAN